MQQSCSIPEEDMDMDMDIPCSTTHSVWQSLDRATSSTSIALLDPDVPLMESVFDGERVVFSFDLRGGLEQTVFISCSFHARPLDYKPANFPQVAKIMSRVEYSLQVLSGKRKRQAEVAEIDCEEMEDHRATKHCCTGLDGDLATWHPYQLMPVAMS